MQRFARLVNPLVDQIGPIRYTELQRLNDVSTHPHNRYYTKSNLFTTLDDDVVDIMCEQFESVPSPRSMLVLQQFGNAIGKVPKDSTAFGHRGQKLEQLAFSAWLDPAEDEIQRQWARDVSQALHPYSHGHYVNQVGSEEDEGNDDLRAAYGDNWEETAGTQAAL